MFSSEPLRAYACNNQEWMYSNVKMNFPQANANCKNHGYQLATPMTDADRDCTAHFPLGPWPFRWTDLRRTDSHTFEYYHYGSRQIIHQDSFRLWAEGQPDNYGGSENFVVQRGCGLYADVSAGMRAGHICQRKPGTQVCHECINSTDGILFLPCIKLH